MPGRLILAFMALALVLSGVALGVELSRSHDRVEIIEPSACDSGSVYACIESPYEGGSVYRHNNSIYRR